MFVEQTKIIIRLMPMAIRLEMTDNAINVNDGAKVKTVVKTLRAHYCINFEILKVWDYGDPSFRKRLFIVGFHRTKVGEYAKLFKQPTIQFDESNSHCARDVAVPDEEVPKVYWRKADDNDVRLKCKQPKPGELRKLPSSAAGIGPANRPHKVHCWDVTHNTQTRINDGRIGPTRMTVPTECVRIASATAGYREYCKHFDISDKFYSSQ